MAIATLYSAKRIEQQFQTGEEPVMVMCSDINTYVCKYMRSSSIAYKLACEFVGAKLAASWQLNTPEVVLVVIRPAHWQGIKTPHNLTAPSIGYRWIDGVVDITPSTCAKVPADISLLRQLMKIALFDFLVANEDRNANNANLMFDVVRNRLVSIDYGCIFNTATFDYPLSQLTSTDTILCSSLFRHLSQDYGRNDISTIVNCLKAEYTEDLCRSREVAAEILNEIPTEWGVPMEQIHAKLNQLHEKLWIDETWNNFEECLNENKV